MTVEEVLAIARLETGVEESPPNSVWCLCNGFLQRQETRSPFGRLPVPRS